MLEKNKQAENGLQSRYSENGMDSSMDSSMD